MGLYVGAKDGYIVGAFVGAVVGAEEDIHVIFT